MRTGRQTLFQPTLPARRATFPTSPARHSKHFNPRSPHGERHKFVTLTCPRYAFQPTLPARGATTGDLQVKARFGISTHAPRTGSDSLVTAVWAGDHIFQPTLPARGATASTSMWPTRDNFNPRSPHGERRYRDATRTDESGFQPTLPARGATRGGDERGGVMAFQPTLPARGATGGFRVSGRGDGFQPTLPARGATAICWTSLWGWIFQPTLPARGATGNHHHQCGDGPISTHAPRTGSDAFSKGAVKFYSDFNPRSPHGERQDGLLPGTGGHHISTHAPRTGSDRKVSNQDGLSPDFNPRSPHGERRLPGAILRLIATISTHAPRTGSDKAKRGESRGRHAFQPTLPARGATPRKAENGHEKGDFNPRSPHGERLKPGTPGMEANNISTHAPRTGSDVAAIYEFVETPEISTHAPRTGSDGLLVQPHSRLAPFQPTLPARGATRDGMGNPAGQRISTHAPRTGSDTIPLFSAFVQRHFNPRSPHGERHGS